MEWRGHINREGTLQLPQPSENAPSSTPLRRRRWAPCIGLCLISVGRERVPGAVVVGRLGRHLSAHAGAHGCSRPHQAPAGRRHGPVTPIRPRSPADHSIVSGLNRASGADVAPVGGAPRSVRRGQSAAVELRAVPPARRHLQRPRTARDRRSNPASGVRELSRERLSGRDADHERVDLRHPPAGLAAAHEPSRMLKTRRARTECAPVVSYVPNRLHLAARAAESINRLLQRL